MKANPYSADCPTRQILDRVGDKWAVLILLLLRFEALRFNQLRRGIEGISQRCCRRCSKPGARRAGQAPRDRNRAGDGGVFDHAARQDAGHGRRSLARLGRDQPEGRAGRAAPLRRAAARQSGVTALSFVMPAKADMDRTTCAARLWRARPRRAARSRKAQHPNPGRPKTTSG